MKKLFSAVLSSALAISLIVSAPGSQAWGQVAATVRPSPAGAGFMGTAGSITPTVNFPALLPTLSLFAPSLSVLNLAPAPVVLSAALIPAAAVPAMKGAVAIPAASKLAALTAELSAASARLATVPDNAGENEGSLNRLSALFDGLDTMSAPSLPEGPNPANTPSLNAPAKSPVYEPFVPATRVVTDMEKLAKTDPAAALKVAAAAILNVNERRTEVKIGAQRILDAMPIAQTLPHYLDLLKLAALADVQTAKAVGTDPWWYIQRTAIKRLSRDAAALKPGTPELVAALTESYKDRNDAVRLAAADALNALGVDPGAEPSYDVVPSKPELMPATPKKITSPSLKKGIARFIKEDIERFKTTVKKDIETFKTTYKNSSALRWLLPVPAILLIAFTGWLFLANPFSGHISQSAPVRNPTPSEIAQTITAQDAAKVTVSATVAPVKADQVKVDPKDAALDQISKDIKRSADASERAAKAAEDMAKPRAEPSMLSNLLWSFGPFILIFFVGSWISRKFINRQNGGGAPEGVNTKPKMHLEKPKTRFADIAGIDESLVEVQEIIDFLRQPERFRKLGARMPKGVLMEGPPGTGKTLLARALAGETNANFISISGSDFVEMYVGMGARRVRELFETAAQNKPAIIFIDEIDAVGKKRGNGGIQGGDAEYEQTINALLKEMDGFDNSSGILVVAATNRADVLDSALTRPGRFDRKIHVGLPEAMGREAILALHAKKARLAAEVDLRLIARRTTGLSGAFLENVINEAALLAARRGGNSISSTDIDEAVDRATIGGKRTLRLPEALKRRIAEHEAGHVLANLLNETVELRVPVNKVTIIPHGSGALGFAESGSEDGNTYLHTQAQLEARLDTALGGLVAEKIFHDGRWSTGPGSDLEAATRIARAMVQQLGMSEELGLAQTAPNQYGQSTFGSEVDSRAHAAINKLLKAAMERTEARLRAGADKHKALIESLMEKETLSSDDIDAIAHPKAK